MSEAKVNQIVELVREKDRIAAEIQRLGGRDAAIDKQIAALVGGALSAPKPNAAASKAAPSKGAKAKRGRRAAKAAKPKATAGAKKPAVANRGRKAAKAGPGVGEQLLSRLRAQPAGVDVSVLAKEVYGGDDQALVKRCEANLYNLARKKLVAHQGPVWRIVAAS